MICRFCYSWCRWERTSRRESFMVAWRCKRKQKMHVEAVKVPDWVRRKMDIDG